MMGDFLLTAGLIAAVTALFAAVAWDMARLPAVVARDGRLQRRRVRLLAERDARVAEDIAWSLREFAYEHAIELSLIRLNLVTVDQLVERLLDHRAESVA